MSQEPLQPVPDVVNPEVGDGGRDVDTLMRTRARIYADYLDRLDEDRDRMRSRIDDACKDSTQAR